MQSGKKAVFDDVRTHNKYNNTQRISEWPYIVPTKCSCTHWIIVTKNKYFVMFTAIRELFTILLHILCIEMSILYCSWCTNRYTLCVSVSLFRCACTVCASLSFDGEHIKWTHLLLLLFFFFSMFFSLLFSVLHSLHTVIIKSPTIIIVVVVVLSMRFFFCLFPSLLFNSSKWKNRMRAQTRKENSHSNWNGTISMRMPFRLQNDQATHILQEGARSNS